MPKLGGAWLSSARVVRCWVNSFNERNPCFKFNALKAVLIRQTEVEEDVKSSCSLCPGLHTCYNGCYNKFGPIVQSKCVNTY